MKKWMHGLLALVAFFSFGMLSTFAGAGDGEKVKKDKGGQIALYTDEKKEEKKDKGSKAVIFGEDKKEEKKDKGK